MRAVLVLAWAALLLAGVVPAAKAVGLPFVDLPTAGSVASDAMDAISGAIVNLIASSVAALMNEIIKVADTVGAPQVGSNNAWFTASYKRTMGVSLYLMAIAALVAITSAGIRGKVGDIAQVVFVGLPGAVVAMMLATVGVQLALALTDAMTAYTFRSSVDDVQTFLHDIGTTFTATDGAAQPTAQLAPGLTLIIGLLLIVAQLVILAVLIVRSALIYIVTLFLPLVFAVQVWPAARHMTRKALELLAVLILSKFAIFTCFALGAAATADVLSPATNGGGPPAVQSAIVGLGVMAAAAFSPMLLMSIVPGIAGSFGAGMPGGTYGSGALGTQSPMQVMRSTLASVHTVRGGSNSAQSATGSTNRGTGAGNKAPSPPAAGAGGSSRAGGARGSSVAEQGHGGAAAGHPAAGAAVATTSVLAQGAQSAARSATAVGSAPASQPAPHEVRSDGSAASSGGGTTPPAPHEVGANAPASSASRFEPHVVGSGPGRAEHDTSATPATPSSAPARSSSDAAQMSLLPTPDDAGGAIDGFTSVQTRKPFTLETT